VTEAVPSRGIMLMETLARTEAFHRLNGLSQISETRVDYLNRCIQLEPNKHSNTAIYS